MSLCDKMREGRFIITSEIGPPKGIDLGRTLASIDALGGRVDAVNVTDLQGSVMRVGSLAVCRALVERGIEPVYQLTCRDRNRLALQSDLLSAALLGIGNVLILTGDHPTLGDHPEAKPVFDLDSVQLIAAARTLQEGADMMGHRLQGAPRFCVGAVVNPGADPLEPEIIKMEKKVAAGASFFQTQAVFDEDVFVRFADRTRHLQVPVLAGIVMLKSGKMARYLNDHVAGLTVPQRIIDEMDAATDAREAAVTIATRTVKALRGHCQGIHFMPIGRDSMVPAVLDKAGL